MTNKTLLVTENFLQKNRLPVIMNLLDIHASDQLLLLQSGFSLLAMY